MAQELELFDLPVDRTARQEECRVKWIKNKCVGTLEACTGFGKTRVGLNCIETLHKHYPNFRMLVVVPTETLYNQWIAQLAERDLSFCTEVVIINTIVKHKWTCNLLVIDEVHRMGADEFSTIFQKVRYRYILGLTATLERLDGKDVIVRKYCPVIDTITLAEARANNWVSPYKEYQVLLHVDDIGEYQKMNAEFNEHFGFFGYDFDLVCNKLVGKDGYKYRLALRDKLVSPNASKQEKSDMLKLITMHAVGAMRVMQQRKKFVNTHPKKIEIANKIIAARNDKKIITFSNTKDMAAQIGKGEVYTGKQTPKQCEAILNRFSTNPSGVLNTCAKANEGLDVKGLSVAIILGMDSSKTKAIQRTGRVIRFEPGKEAEIFTLVIAGTVEANWFTNSHPDKSKYITIDEAELEKVLNHEEFKTYQKPIPKMSFRF